MDQIGMPAISSIQTHERTLAHVIIKKYDNLKGW